MEEIVEARFFRTAEVAAGKNLGETGKVGKWDWHYYSMSYHFGESGIDLHFHRIHDRFFLERT